MSSQTSFLAGGVAQQVGRVVGRHHRDALVARRRGRGGARSARPSSAATGRRTCRAPPAPAAGSPGSAPRGTAGRHRISSGSGLRFCGGRHLMTLAMKTSARAHLHALLDDVGQELARRGRRTRGPARPRRRPAPRPRTSARRSGLPWPKTIVLRPPASLQRRQSPRSARIAARAVGAVVRARRRRAHRGAAAGLPPDGSASRAAARRGGQATPTELEARQEAAVRAGGRPAISSRSLTPRRRGRGAPARSAAHLVEDPLGHLALAEASGTSTSPAVASQQHDRVRLAGEARARAR